MGHTHVLSPESELVTSTEDYVQMVMGLHPEASFTEQYEALAKMIDEPELLAQAASCLMVRRREIFDAGQESRCVDTGQLLRHLTVQSEQMRSRLSQITDENGDQDEEL
jgi:hypothetical protein